MRIEFNGKYLTDFMDTYSKEYEQFVKYGKNKQLAYDIKGNINFDDILWWIFTFIVPKSENNREYELIQLFKILKDGLKNKNLQVKTKRNNISALLNVSNVNIVIQLLLSVNNSLILYMNRYYNLMGKHDNEINKFEKQYITDQELIELSPEFDDYLRKEATSKYYTLCTNDEIKIIEDQLNYYKNNRLTEIKELIGILLNKLRKVKAFRTDLKTIATNEACFLYDILDYFEIVPNADFMNSQEKYQFIKRYLK
ncbi:MAG: hypothetical protein P4L28_00335 [Paludibacteraceae bacterium]|nr:hypothetical protein [Paludibacteraceae bacterium]